MSFVAFCGAIGFLVGGANGCATGVIFGASILGAIQIL
jgi:hypothetical protein